MSNRTALLREQEEWLELQQCRGWARLAAWLEGELVPDIEALKTMDPAGPALPRAQGRVARGEAVLRKPERRMAEIVTELKEKGDG